MNSDTDTDSQRETFRLTLPEPPAEQRDFAVQLWEESVDMLTWSPEPADANPMFLDKRVYQGSSGQVYPLPFTDRIASEPRMQRWRAVHLQNRFIRLMILPEIGGRIHVGLDRMNNYDFFYRQNVIKPALVGLAGPWASGGVEFNWPQHHRPATFMPATIALERSPDGSATVWCSDYDRMSGMKGMHGVCLRPASTRVEVTGRLYNGTPLTQTFCWWANAAVRVHEQYQSFFPPDVHTVVDHARRAVSSFPLCDGVYYGVDYAKRAREGVPNEERPAQFVPDRHHPPNDLSWYSNIPVPTSYMAVGSQQDFFGGYDHRQQAGIVHVADHRIAPGKKQWTWGNHEFGYAWDRLLTENDGPYIELMAGVFTDNQPDFSFLAPGETRVFTQCWYPIRQIGSPQAASREAALHCERCINGIRLAICVTEDIGDAELRVEAGLEVLARWAGPLYVETVWERSWAISPAPAGSHLVVRFLSCGRELLRYEPDTVLEAKTVRAATEPPEPQLIGTVEELYLTGLHLEQYRHATRKPEIYWREALLRDPADTRVNQAIGMTCLRRGEFELARKHFEIAIDRLTRWNHNPRDGEIWLNLGLTLRYMGDQDSARDAFTKAAWNEAQQSQAYYALASLHAQKGEWIEALASAERVLRKNADHLQARNLRAVVLLRLGRTKFAEAAVGETRTLDPLDLWSRYTALGEAPTAGWLRLHLAFELVDAGLADEALDLLQQPLLNDTDGAAPMLAYLRAQLHDGRFEAELAAKARAQARDASVRWCFPHRVEEIGVLNAAIAANGQDARAPYLLGNLFYSKGRYEEALALWERSAKLDPSFSTVWRNLGIAYFNVIQNPTLAKEAFDCAFFADPTDARILFERDQLWKRIGVSPGQRLQELESFPLLVMSRDDLSLEQASLLNLVGQPERSLKQLLNRRFAPWEGGEGMLRAHYVRTRLLLGQAALAKREHKIAIGQFESALETPASLGEARHLLESRAEIYFWLGEACAANEQRKAAVWWNRAIEEDGEATTSVLSGKEATAYWKAMALRRLNRMAEAEAVLNGMQQRAEEMKSVTSSVDYFTTSLPSLLLFNDEGRKQHTDALILRAQVHAARGQTKHAYDLLEQLFEADNSLVEAFYFMRGLGAPSGA